MADYINVTSLNRLARQVLAQCEPLNDLIVCGEISGFVRHYKSGHMYFTLKDETASVKSVMFRNSAQLLNFQPQNGMLVLAYGHATIYERDGAFQLYVDYMKPFGAGAAQMAFDALYKKLDAEGLFAPERKRPLPPVPQCIGVVTSKTGAAWQDVQNVIGRRWPMVKLLLAPVNVQGIEAERSIVAGIRALDADKRPDLILVTRGGGSKEDLWVFNSERIARAAFEYARKNGKHNVTAITKANIVKLADGNFLKAVHHIGETEYPDIEVQERLVDAMTAKMADPEFTRGCEVFVLPNLYGDIVTDAAAEMQGGLGSASSSNIGNKYALFEAIHGTAPFLINHGRGQYANPCSLIRAAGQLMAHIGYGDRTAKLEKALDICCNTEKKLVVTTDKDGATSEEFTTYLLDTLKSL